VSLARRQMQGHAAGFIDGRRVDLGAQPPSRASKSLI
jgi:hypothetical protein